MNERYFLWLRQKSGARDVIEIAASELMWLNKYFEWPAPKNTSGDMGLHCIHRVLTAFGDRVRVNFDEVVIARILKRAGPTKSAQINPLEAEDVYDDPCN